MANSWTLTVIVLLSIFMARSQTRDFKEQNFIPGSDVILQCGNATVIRWNELIYIVWNISLEGRKCWLGLSPKLDDTCKDRKRLLNTSDGVSLVIPKISTRDEGFYSCDVSYKAGSYAVNVSVSVTQLFTKQSENNQRIAVCQANYTQKTAPTLHWEPALNFSSSNSSVKKHGRFFTMENQVYLPDNVNISELICVATYSSESGSVQHKSTLHLKISHSGTQETSSFPVKIIAISVGSTCIFFFVVSLAVVYILRRKLYNLSALKMLCCKSKISTPSEDKPPQHTSVCMNPLMLKRWNPMQATYRESTPSTTPQLSSSTPETHALFMMKQDTRRERRA
ncbi:uncharacterized protein si:ch211-214p13.9 isoform X2 [Cyprinus carpio]|uniref:Uncharacterized protein si:ch211-214p13.9 isoform X2 n=1 Tax=Cyprinus carpio TaxID=7962 RepID=A0A9Q9WPM7_CYPCA|nr:uncharacterized protein si:ch211-214p13.9 isoform X2 [Cyprinus carpio]